MRFVVIALVALLVVPRVVAAQPDDAIARGVELREQGRDEEALELFERAYARDPRPELLAQRALAEQALGRWVNAERHLQQALAARGDPWIRRLSEVLTAALAEIRTHLGALAVESNVAGAELLVDGRVVTSLPAPDPVRLPIGRAEIEVRAPRHRTVHRVVRIRPGELARETVQLLPIAEGGEAPRPAASGSTTSTVLLVLGGVAVATAVGGLVWWIDRQSELDFCDDASCTNRDALVSARDAAAALTLVALGVGVGLGVAGYLTLPTDDAASSGVACALGLGIGSCRLAF